MVNSREKINKVQTDKQVKHRKCKEYGVTREQFHNLIKKSAQPIKKSDSENT